MFLFSKKKRCKTCGSRFTLWLYKGLVRGDTCKVCYRRQVKGDAKRKRKVKLLQCLTGAKLKCKCGLIFKAGHKGFSLSGVNRALVQLFDFGIDRHGSKWVEGEMMNRGIYCRVCIKSAPKLNRGSNIVQSKGTSNIVSKTNEVMKEDRNKKKSGDDGGNWWDKI